MRRFVRLVLIHFSLGLAAACGGGAGGGEDVGGGDAQSDADSGTVTPECSEATQSAAAACCPAEIAAGEPGGPPIGATKIPDCETGAVVEIPCVRQADLAGGTAGVETEEQVGPEVVQDASPSAACADAMDVAFDRKCQKQPPGGEPAFVHRAARRIKPASA